jgi:KDO2-lipid IV(A) lauroyltransferase
MFTAKRCSLGKGWIINAKRLDSFSSNANTAAKELNNAIEDAILIAPEQFIWSYNRYKHPAGAELPPQD